MGEEKDTYMVVFYDDEKHKACQYTKDSAIYLSDTRWEVSNKGGTKKAAIKTDVFHGQEFIILENAKVLPPEQLEETKTSTKAKGRLSVLEAAAAKKSPNKRGKNSPRNSPRGRKKVDDEVKEEIETDDLFDKNIAILKQKTFWCAASTHNGEEIICLKTHLNLKRIYNDLITVIIPRHINRSMEINDLCKKYGLLSQILGNEESIKDNSEIIIINSFGTLSKFYNYSKSVFIGKSMIKKLQKVGGQNPIEAAKLGCKIYHGPHVYNFKEIYDLLKSYKISEEVNNEKDLSKKLEYDFKNSKNDQDKITIRINNLGQNILNNSVKEINKFLI